MTETLSFFLGAACILLIPILFLGTLIYGEKTCPYCRKRINRKAVNARIAARMFRRNRRKRSKPRSARRPWALTPPEEIRDDTPGRDEEPDGGALTGAGDFQHQLTIELQTSELRDPSIGIFPVVGGYDDAPLAVIVFVGASETLALPQRRTSHGPYLPLLQGQKSRVAMVSERRQ